MYFLLYVFSSILSILFYWILRACPSQQARYLRQHPSWTGPGIWWYGIPRQGLSLYPAWTTPGRIWWLLLLIWLPWDKGWPSGGIGPLKNQIAVLIERNALPVLQGRLVCLPQGWSDSYIYVSVRDDMGRGLFGCILAGVSIRIKSLKKVARMGLMALEAAVRCSAHVTSGSVALPVFRALIAWVISRCELVVWHHVVEPYWCITCSSSALSRNLAFQLIFVSGFVRSS